MSHVDGWEVVCPDGRVRHYPYFNEGDARCDADVLARRGCEIDPDWWEKLPACPGGDHAVRTRRFEPPGQA